MVDESKIQITSRAAFNGLLVLEQLLGRRLFGFLLGGCKSALMRRMEARLRELPRVSARQVERRKDLSPEVFHSQYFRRSQPVVFAGAAREWTCCQQWSLDYFSGAHGESDLFLADAPGLTTRQHSSNHEFLTVKELVQNIKSGGDKYLRFSPLLQQTPALAAALDLDWLGEMRGGQTFGNTFYMFMGGLGRRTLLHADQPCNLYVQVTGEKKWTMFLPEDSACLYPEVTGTAYVKSPVDIDQRDDAKFPLFRQARAFEAHLYPGDVLYVPPHVWHQVENLTDTIAVGYRFSSLKAALSSSLTMTLLRVLSMNPPLWKTRAYGKVDTNLIWAHASGKINEVLTQMNHRRGKPAVPRDERSPRGTV